MVRRDEESILKKAMILQVNGQRKRGRPRQTWKRQVEESLKKIGWIVEEATDRVRWREGVRVIAEGMREATSARLRTRGKTGLKLDYYDVYTPPTMIAKSILFPFARFEMRVFTSLCSHWRRLSLCSHRLRLRNTRLSPNNFNMLSNRL